jgi:hypothetical protein
MGLVQRPIEVILHYLWHGERQIEFGHLPQHRGSPRSLSQHSLRTRKPCNPLAFHHDGIVKRAVDQARRQASELGMSCRKHVHQHIDTLPTHQNVTSDQRPPTGWRRLHPSRCFLGKAAGASHCLSDLLQTAAPAPPERKTANGSGN